MKKAHFHTLLKFGGASLALIFLSGCTESAFVAYERTPIFGSSREVVRTAEGYAYNFPYRGGTVTYLPDRGSYWEKSSAGKIPAKTVGNAAPTMNLNSRLPHGCLVFACARAEEIRRGSTPGATRSEAIAFQRTDGSGHAFVVYDLNGRTIAEDDRGYRVSIANWKSRSPEEALALARAFSVQTHPEDFPKPANAKFMGEY